MTGRPSSFADLLVPVRPETFFERYWESKPLHVRRSESHHYAQILTNRDVEAAISSGGLRCPGIQLARGGGFFPPETFTRTIRSGVIFSPASPTSTAFVPSINSVLPFRCRGSTGLGSRSARSPPRTRRSSTMRYTRTGWVGADVLSPTVNLPLRTNGDGAWFGWPSDDKIEALRGR
jgi:hypothetical protein